MRAAGPLRVGLVGLIAGGHSGVPRYAAALIKALDDVAPEYHQLEMSLLTTTAGRDRVRPQNIATELLEGRASAATGGPRRVLAEQLAARASRAQLLHFFDLTCPLLRPGRAFTTTLHDVAVFHGFQGVRVAHKRVLARVALRRARAVVAVSASARDDAVARLGADEARIAVVHSGPGLVASADGGAGPPAGTVDRPPVPPYLLYVGNLLAHKNLPFLIRAYAASGVGAPLVLVGSWGDSADQVRAAISDSPARERIDLRSGVSDAGLDNLYREAAALLLPSLYEGFGFTALEAMARGCPVLGSDIPALREVCGDGAKLLPPSDEDAWTAAIQALLADPGIGQELRRRGAIVAGRYTWERTARGVCEVLLAAGEAL